jgi:hypothetical protein
MAMGRRVGRKIELERPDNYCGSKKQAFYLGLAEEPRSLAPQWIAAIVSC